MTHSLKVHYSNGDHAACRTPRTMTAMVDAMDAAQTTELAAVTCKRCKWIAIDATFRTALAAS